MADMSFEGRVALVTGVGPNGLGLAYAELLASRGARVVVNDLGVSWAGESIPNGTENAVARIKDAGGEAVGVTGDIVTDSARIVDAAVDAYGQLDILINNAGAGGDFDTMLRVHASGTHRMTQAAWPHLQKSDAARVVNTASNATWGSAGEPGYASAKSAVIALTRVQAKNGAGVGIRSNVVLPSAWTVSTAGIPDAAIGRFLEEHFDAGHVTSFVAYLAHESCSVSGEAFGVGAGVVSRVVQARSEGVVDLNMKPEHWRDQIDQVMNSDNLIVPGSMWGDVGEQARRLGPEAHAAFKSLDFSGVGGI